MRTIYDVLKYLERYEELDVEELIALELDLNELLKSISKKLNPSSGNSKTSSPPCPHCSSSNTIKHTKGQNPRYRCKKCLSTFSAHRQPLYHRKQKKNELLDLIVYIRTTDMSITEISKKLRISSKTCRVWRDQLISVLPQLAENFNNRGKK